MDFLQCEKQLKEGGKEGRKEGRKREESNEIMQVAVSQLSTDAGLADPCTYDRATLGWFNGNYKLLATDFIGIGHSMNVFAILL